MHQEAITSGANVVLEKLSLPSGFYLAGGTALALQIGHRRSEDLDFFNEKPIRPDLLPRLEKDFNNLTQKLIINNAEELTLFIGTTKVAFLRYPFSLIFPPVSFGNFKLASIKEIAFMKAYALGRRGTFKDYVDLYFIVKDGYVTLEEIIELAAQKYADKSEPRLFLEQLVYFGDVEDVDIIFLSEKINTQSLIKFFEKKVKQIRL